MRAGSIVVFAAYFLAFFLVGLAGWIGGSFDNPSIDQILYHLHFSEGAAIRLSRVFVFTFVAECLGFPLLFAAVATFAQLRITRALAKNGLLMPRPRWRRALHGHALARALPLMAALAGLSALLMQLSAFSYAASFVAEDRFSRHFIDAGTVGVQAVDPRNLVLIYVESLEDAYGDTRLFSRDLLLPVRRSGGARFSSYQPAEGTTWTIAGMVGTQCGVPLRVYSEYDIKRSDPQARAFMPSATCLADILTRHGYRNVFMGGAPLSFAGKGAFLRDHGYQETWGREEWEREGAKPEEMGEWGLYDSALFERAKRRLQSLHASGQKFNLTLLTLDTHNPHGFMSPYCRGRGARDFEGIVGCASEQLADFVMFMTSNGLLKDTAVVILGDHLAVPNPVYDRLQRADQRRIYNQFIAESLPQRNTDEVLPFDMFPTMLEFIGFRVPGDRLGLGYSAFHPPEVERPRERLAELTLPSLGGSASYNQLWRKPAH